MQSRPRALTGESTTASFSYAVGTRTAPAPPHLVAPLKPTLSYVGTLTMTAQTCVGGACAPITRIGANSAQLEGDVGWAEQWTEEIDDHGDYSVSSDLSSVQGSLTGQVNLPSAGRYVSFDCALASSDPSGSLSNSLFLAPAGEHPISAPYGADPVYAVSPPASPDQTSASWSSVTGQVFTPWYFNSGNDPDGQADGDITLGGTVIGGGAGNESEACVPQLVP